MADIDNENLFGQYELIVGIFEAELSRFWTRFNIFSALQIGSLVAMINSLQILISNIALYRFFLIFLMLFSAFFAIITIRAMNTQKRIVKTIFEIEEISGGRICLGTLLRKHSKASDYFTHTFGVVFTSVIFLFWLVLLIFLEVNNYHF